MSSNEPQILYVMLLLHHLSSQCIRCKYWHVRPIAAYENRSGQSMQHQLQHHQCSMSSNVAQILNVMLLLHHLSRPMHTLQLTADEAIATHENRSGQSMQHQLKHHHYSFPSDEGQILYVMLLLHHLSNQCTRCKTWHVKPHCSVWSLVWTINAA